ncbi:MAG: RagB/SusD family nutrient uptake outer membrane protein, partial [Bacteroidaceae bacterium]
MKKIIICSLIACMLTGCENFLDTDNLTKKDNSNFPQTSQDAQAAITGAYAMLRATTDGLESQCIFITSELLSDDRFGGGGKDDRGAQAVDQLKKNADNMFADPWHNNFAGIFRCNMLLESIENITEWENDAMRSQIIAEAHFLRAYFYFDLCKMYGTVPLLTTTKAVNNPRATADELFALIASDLKEAIANFPATKIQDIPVDQLGHATKWAAEGILARAYLFYTGYYKKESMPLADGGTLSTQEVINYLDDCIANSGHNLIPDFRNLWPYSNKLSKEGYKYSKNNNLEWIGEEGANIETIFAIKFGAIADWGITSDYSNSPNLFFSIRDQDTNGIYPFGLGWGYGTVNSNLWSDWESKEPKDIRREASILNVENPNEGLKDYQYG